LTDDLGIVLESPRACLSVQVSQQCLSEAEDARVCYSGAPVELNLCDQGAAQIWSHDLKTKRLFSRVAGYSYCLTWLNETLSIQSCFPGGSPSQKWYFARGKTAAAPERGLLRTMIKGISEPYSYGKVLKAPHSPDKKKKKSEGIRVRFEWVGSECGFHPVTGVWLGRCF
jgi:hypothetical protein